MILAEHAIHTIDFVVHPLRALVDEPVSIKLSHCTPKQVVTILARACDDAQEPWMSSATFVADSAGEISLDTQKPATGSYQGIEPLGLFWSMLPIHKEYKAPFMRDIDAPLVITISAETGGQPIGSTSIELSFSNPDIVRVPVREQGLVGIFCQPAAPGPYPGVLLLSGSDGALRENQAALLASHGYAVLTLAYFRYEGLPEQLVDIPLEYFEQALHWLQRQTLVDEKHLAVIGLSRGGELALLLAATFPAIKAVVAGSPSAHMHAGILDNDYSRSAWTHHDEPLPHLNARMNIFTGIALMWYSLTLKALSLRPIFLTTLKDHENLAEATIPVEKIQGPVLLISGQDDQMWPATLFADMVIARLASHNHAYPYTHVSYKGAGHFVCFPYGYPSLPPMVRPLGGMAFGGSTQANAAASADSWRKILAFLQESLHGANKEDTLL